MRLLVTGASLGDSVALVALLGLYGFHYYTEGRKEAPINETVKKHISSLEANLQSLHEEVKQLKNTASGQKVVNQMATPKAMKF